MRDTERIASFLTRLGRVWERECPDWRFGQLITNVFDKYKIDPFFLEEEEFLKVVENFFAPPEDVDKVINKGENK